MVELVNHNLSYVLQSLGFPDGAAGDAIVNGWESVRPQIMEIVYGTLETSDARWSFVSVFYCGRDRTKANPTILIMIDGVGNGRAVANWAEIEGDMKEVLVQNKLHDWEVGFAYGAFSGRDSDSNSDSDVDVEPDTDSVRDSPGSRDDLE